MGQQRMNPNAPPDQPAGLVLADPPLGDALEYRRAEPIILALVAERLGVKLTRDPMQVGGTARVDVDGVDADRSVFVEVFAHVGRLKGGQRHKVSNDALKLITLGREHPNARLVIAFADAEAAAFVIGRSWLAVALRSAGIEVVVADIDDALRDELRAAQKRLYR
jgi:hypothetical protein